MTETDVRRIEDKVDGVSLVLAELKGSLQPTLEKLTDKQVEVDDTLRDHESRIRAGERFRYALPTTSVLAVLIAGAALIYSLFPTGGH